MSFMQGGAYVGGDRPKTKKALRTGVKFDPAGVRLASTDLMGAGFSGPVTQLPEGVTFTVVGPDPYARRNWYANVVRKGDRIKVS